MGPDSGLIEWQDIVSPNGSDLELPDGHNILVPMWFNVLDDPRPDVAHIDQPESVEHLIYDEEYFHQEVDEHQADHQPTISNCGHRVLGPVGEVHEVEREDADPVLVEEVKLIP